MLLCGPASASEPSRQNPASVDEQRARPIIHFYCSIKSQSKLFHAYEDLYRDVFDQLNYDFRMSYIPSLRGISGLLSGQADGSCGRSAQLSKSSDHNKLIHINVTIARSELIVWTKESRYSAIRREDLLSRDYRVGIVRGASRPKRFINQYQLAATELTSLKIGLKMLQVGRLDLVIASSIMIPTALEEDPKLTAPHKALTLEQADLYPYLIQKHRHLKARFTKVLQQTLADPSHTIHQFSNLKPAGQ